MHRKGISVLVVDDNREFTDLLSKKLARCEDLNITGIARNGMEALEMIKLVQPDIVLLDIIIPGIDGLCVLERAVSGGLCPGVSFIIVTTTGHDSVIKKAARFGVEYYMLKPFMVEVLLRRIRQVYLESSKRNQGMSRNGRMWYLRSKNLLCSESNTNVLIAEMVRRMGVLSNITGYHYLLEAISMVIDKPCIKGCVTKMLYPAVAEKFNTTPKKVERSIRNAISISWGKGNTGLREMYKDRPTNSEFICSIAEWVKIANQCQ